jgi:hypothetical protein
MAVLDNLDFEKMFVASLRSSLLLGIDDNIRERSVAVLSSERLVVFPSYVRVGSSITLSLRPDDPYPWMEVPGSWHFAGSFVLDRI